MKRKLVKQGISTLMISIPSQWIKSNNLEKGDEISLESKDNNLIISSEIKKKQKKEISIQIDSENKHDIKNILTHLYRKGFDRIIINNIDKDSLKKVKETTQDLLLGFEMVDSEKEKCIIENISEPSYEKYETILRRVFLIIKETHEITKNDLDKNSLKRYSEIDELRKQQDKYILFCRRLIMKQENELDSILKWELLTFLMHIEHKYAYLYKYGQENKIKSDKDLQNLLNLLENYFDLFYESYFKKDIKNIHKINLLKDQYHFGNLIKILEKSTGKKAVMLSYLSEIFRLIQIATSPILVQFLDNGHYY